MNRPTLLWPYLLLLSAVSAAAETYYVSSSCGDDRHSGTRPEAAWKSLGRVNQVALQAGDRILLKSDDTFVDDSLVFDASDCGLRCNQLVVDIYGGEKPAILRPPDGHNGITIRNTGGILVRNLEIVGPGQKVSDATECLGVSLWCDRKDGRRETDISLERLVIHDFYRGISIGADDPSFSGFQDVAVVDCVVRSCLSDGIVTFGTRVGAGRERQSHRNLRITRTTVSDCRGDPTLDGPHSGSGIILSGTVGGLVEDCVAHDNGGGTNDRDGGGPVGIWCWGCHAVTIQRCLVYNQRSTPGVQDGGGFDIDGGATGCVIQYCYSYHNEGYGYLVCEFTGAPPLQDATVRYNISHGDGRARAQAGLGVWNGNPTVVSFRRVVFHNNLVICDASAGSVVKTGFETNPLEVAFVNNAFIRTGGSLLVDCERHVGSVLFRSNLYWTADRRGAWGWDGQIYGTLEDWRTGTSAPESTDGRPSGLFADPLIVGLATEPPIITIADMAASPPFLPSPESPLANSGVRPPPGAVEPPTRDFRGRPVSKDAWDIGAYELK